MNKAVLIIDDDSDLRALLRLTLQVAGFDAVEAADGQSGLRALADREIHAVVLDMVMPGMSGLEVLGQIRKDHPLNRLPVLMLTGRSDSSETVAALDAGASDYLVKPCDFEVVVAKLRKELTLLEGARPNDPPRLRPLKKPRTQTLRAHYCPTCQTCVDQSLRRCEYCTGMAPPSGWPALDTDGPWPFLGRIVEGRYLCERFLGAGAFSQVYRARDLDLDRRFALKVIDLTSPMFQSTDDARAMIAAEVSSLAAVDSPHAVRLYELFDLGPTTVGLLMGWAMGQNLAELLRLTRRLVPAVALDIARQTALGLAEVHQHGLVHRDVKPANVVVSTHAGGGYHATVLDFGLAKRTTDVTTGARTGTATYMAPEQVMGGVTGPRADVYGLGCVLMEMLTGDPPYVGSETEQFVNHIHAPPPRVRVRVPSVPASIDALVAAMLSKEPRDRPRSMSDVVRQIDAVRGELEAQGPAGPEYVGAPFPWPAPVVAAAMLPGDRAVVATPGEQLRLVTMDFRSGARDTLELAAAPVSLLAADDAGAFLVAFHPVRQTFSVISVWGKAVTATFAVDDAQDPVTCVAIAPGGSAVWWGTGGGSVTRRVASGDADVLLPGGTTITAVCPVADGGYIQALASRTMRRVGPTGRVSWEARLGTPVVSIQAPFHGRRAAVRTRGGLIHLLDVASGHCSPGVEMESELLAVCQGRGTRALVRDTAGLHLVDLSLELPGDPGGDSGPAPGSPAPTKNWPM